MSPTRPTPRPAWQAALAGLLLTLPLLASPATADDLPDVPLLPGDDDAPAARRVDRSFKVATLNILGSQHTRGGDRRRTLRTARLIRRQNISLTGLQEVQQDQHHWLRKQLPAYRIWPGMKYDAQGIRLQIGWRKKRFDKLDHGTITTTFSHQRRPIPWVRLRDEKTGRRLFVIDIHNSPLRQERARDRATRKEIRLFNRLDEKPGATLMVGDANERREWFCNVTGRTRARAANGGSHTRSRCNPPEPTFIDWIMGAGRFDWRHYDSRDVKVSDHPLHTAVLHWR